MKLGLNEVNEVRIESSVKGLCCWSVLQRVAVCCSVLQCVEDRIE